MAESVQNTYRRAINPFVAGQVATGRDCQFDSGRFTVVNSRATLPFGYAVGLVDGPAETGGGTNVSVSNRYLLKGNACALNFTTSGTGTDTIVTNFGGIAHRNVSLPGSGTQVQGAAADTLRVVDAYNENDLVSIGSEGDFVVVCSAAVTIRSRVLISTAASTYGQFLTGNPSSTNPAVPGAIFMTDSTSVTPYSGGSAQILAVVRIRLQPR